MDKKLPFSKEDYFRLLSDKLTKPAPTSNPFIERLKQAATRVRASKAKYN